MHQRIVLLTVRYEKKGATSPRAVLVLVNAAHAPWSAVTTDVNPGELPIEAAVREGEKLFGYGSISSIWLLGRVQEEAVTHFYCLDTDSLGIDVPQEISGYQWVDLDSVVQQYNGNVRTLVEKMRAYENN